MTNTDEKNFNTAIGNTVLSADKNYGLWNENI